MSGLVCLAEGLAGCPPQAGRVNALSSKTGDWTTGFTAQPCRASGHQGLEGILLRFPLN